MNHTVGVYIYNPQNLKEVLDIVKFKIRYVPTQKWYKYLILVNDVYSGVDVNLTELRGHIKQNKSSRELVAKAIKNYKEGINLKYQNRKNIVAKDLENLSFIKNTFHKKLLNIADFKSRDELTKYNIILNIN